MCRQLCLSLCIPQAALLFCCRPAFLASPHDATLHSLRASLPLHPTQTPPLPPPCLPGAVPGGAAKLVVALRGRRRRQPGRRVLRQPDRGHLLAGAGGRGAAAGWVGCGAAGKLTLGCTLSSVSCPWGGCRRLARPTRCLGARLLPGPFSPHCTMSAPTCAHQTHRSLSPPMLADLGVGGDSSYSPGWALYSLARTSAGPSTPDSPAPTPDPVASSGSGLSAGAIAGIAAGAAVAAVALAAACVVWRRRRGRAQQVAAAPKCAPPSPRLTPKSHSLDSKDGTGNGTGTDGTAACTTVVIHLDSDDASSQAAATASADSVVLAAGGLAPLVGGSAAKARGHSALARAIARQQSDTSGSPPGTAHSVLPGGRDNPFNRHEIVGGCRCLLLRNRQSAGAS